MDEKPVRQGVPVWQVKEEPVFSTCRLSFDTLIIPACWTLGLYIINIYGHRDIAYFYHPAILIPLGQLAYYFIWKRRNHKFLAEDGLYFVKRGYAVFVPWEKVKGAVVELPPMGCIRVELLECLMDDETGTPVVFEDADELRFPYHRKAEECFLRHVPVTGDEKWEKKRKKRAGQIDSASTGDGSLC